MAPHRADIVGTGYRCEACSLAAQLAAANGELDLCDNLTVGDRARIARRGRVKMFAGVTSTSFLVAMLAILMTGGTTSVLSAILMSVTLCATVGLTGTGYLEWRRTASLPALATVRLLTKG